MSSREGKCRAEEIEVSVLAGRIAVEEAVGRAGAGGVGDAGGGVGV